MNFLSMILNFFGGRSLALAVPAAAVAAPDGEERVMRLAREFRAKLRDANEEALILQRQGHADLAIATLRQRVATNQGEVLQRLRTLARVAGPSNPNEAIAAYKHVLASVDMDAAARHDLVELYLKIGRYGEALEYINAMIARAREPRLRVIAKALKATALAHLGRREEAEAAFEEASALEVEDVADRAQAGLLLGRAGEALQSQRARAFYVGAIKDSDTAQATLVFAGAEAGLGRLDLSVGAIEDAERHFRRALGLCEHAGELHGVASALEALGVCRRQAGDREGAQANFERALRIFRQLEDTLGVARVLLDLADLAGSDQARAQHQEAATLVAERGLEDTPIGKRALAVSALAN